MMNCTSELLDEARRASRPIYLLVQLLQIVLCILSPIIFQFQAVAYKKVYSDPNIRVMLNFYRFTTFCYCASFTIIESYHFISRFFLSDCDLLVPVKTCIWFRIVQSWASVALQMFYIGVVIQIILSRLISVLHETKWFPRTIGLILGLMAFQTVFPSLFIDLESDGYLSNCASLENKKKATLGGIFLKFLTLDIISLVSFFLLRIYIACFYSVKRTKYNINKTIRRKELRHTFNLMLPNIILHVIIYVYVSISSMFVFSNFESFKDPQMEFMMSNAVPFYVFAAPLVWCMVSHRQKQKNCIKPLGDPRDVHFSQLSKQWSEKRPVQQSKPSGNSKSST